MFTCSFRKQYRKKKMEISKKTSGIRVPDETVVIGLATTEYSMPQDRKVGRDKGPVRDAVEALNVGESIQIDSDFPNKIESARVTVKHVKRILNRTFRCKVSANGTSVRIWRTS